MPVLIAFLIALLLLPAHAGAACTGTDLRTTLSAEQRREIRAAVDETPFPQGNHWIARRGDQTIHLIGTMHLNDPRMDAISERMATLLDRADLLLLEVDRASMVDFMSGSFDDLSAFLLTSGPTLVDMMGDETWAEFSDVLRAQAIPPWFAAKMRPWLLDQMLSIPPCLRNNKKAGNGLDRRLEAVARGKDVQVLSLETMDEVLAVMNAKPLDQQVQELLTSLPLYSNALSYFATMREGYFDEDIVLTLETIRRYARTASELPTEAWDDRWNDFQSRILVERNGRWMPRILARRENDIVIAVGAAHLGGETGLLNQLGGNGFEISRAAF